jgi:hypothetical protein
MKDRGAIGAMMHWITRSAGARQFGWGQFNAETSSTRVLLQPTAGELFAEFDSATVSYEEKRTSIKNYLTYARHRNKFPIRKHFKN